MGGATPVRYRSPDEDSGRWTGFPFRDGDIVVSTRSKSGTTWVQTICALLVFGSPELPQPLGVLSPWLDWVVMPVEDVVARLEAQSHRRIVKTHTPLDGIPIDARATYVVVARDPLDMAVSLYHQGDNLDRERIRSLTGAAAPAAHASRPPLREWLRGWITWDGDPRTHLDSLPGVMMHLRDAWSRRHEPNVVLVHYDDLSTDLEGEMRRLAARLHVDVREDVWRLLVDAARFDNMRARAGELVPDPVGVLRDRSRFFRIGVSGEGRALLTDDELARYDERVAALAPPDLLAWLHRPTGVAPMEQARRATVKRSGR